CGGGRLLADLAGYLREHVVRVAADQTDGADHDHQNYGEHYRIFCNVLRLFIAPQELPQICHSRTPLTSTENPTRDEPGNKFLVCALVSQIPEGSGKHFFTFLTF